MNQANPNYKLWAGILLAIIMVPAYIYMKEKGLDDSGLMYLLGPIATYMLVGAKVEQVTQDQNQTLNKIQEQTNGVLDNRIQKAVLAALKDQEASKQESQ